MTATSTSQHLTPGAKPGASGTAPDLMQSIRPNNPAHSIFSVKGDFLFLETEVLANIKALQTPSPTLVHDHPKDSHGKLIIEPGSVDAFRINFGSNIISKLNAIQNRWKDAVEITAENQFTEEGTLEFLGAANLARSVTETFYTFSDSAKGSKNYSFTEYLQTSFDELLSPISRLYIRASAVADVIGRTEDSETAREFLNWDWQNFTEIFVPKSHPDKIYLKQTSTEETISSLMHAYGKAGQYGPASYNKLISLLNEFCEFIEKERPERAALTRDALTKVIKNGDSWAGDAYIKEALENPELANKMMRRQSDSVLKYSMDDWTNALKEFSPKLQELVTRMDNVAKNLVGQSQA